MIIYEFLVNELDEIRRAYLIVGPYQLRNIEYLYKGLNNHHRSFQSSWFESHSNWLKYLPSSDAIYCLPYYLAIFFICVHWIRQFFMFVNVQKYDDIWKLIILYLINLWIIFSIFLLQLAPSKYLFFTTPLIIIIIIIIIILLEPIPSMTPQVFIFDYAPYKLCSLWLKEFDNAF